MHSILVILFPIFGLILSGYMCRRQRILGPASTKELNRFVVWLALPALLFLAMATTPLQELCQPGFAAAFGLPSLAAYAGVLLWRMRSGSQLVDASVDAISASYSNTGFVGIPLATLAFGPRRAAAATISTVIVVCVLFAVAVIAMEVGLQQAASRAQLAKKVTLSVIRNPLVIAPALGVAVSAAGMPLPRGLQLLLKMLGGSATPCALVGLGLFLGERRQFRAQKATLAWPLVAIKLLILPALTWSLATFVFALSPFQAALAIAMAALPTGTGPFMLA